MVNTKSSSKDKTTSSQSVVIAVLATVIACFLIVMVVLIATGVIKFGGSANSGEVNSGGGTSISGGTGTNGGSTTGDGSNIIDNPNPFVEVNNATAVVVRDLSFYLPRHFEDGGKNADGAFTYNLVNDDGWAQVLVYVEKTDLTPEKYLNKISSYLDITDKNYQMNGTTWVQGENATSLAYATELDGTVYAVYYAVKLDSDSTTEAMSMIPKTLYMSKIYK